MKHSKWVLKFISKNKSKKWSRCSDGPKEALAGGRARGGPGYL